MTVAGPLREKAMASVKTRQSKWGEDVQAAVSAMKEKRADRYFTQTIVALVEHGIASGRADDELDNARRICKGSRRTFSVPVEIDEEVAKYGATRGGYEIAYLAHILAGLATVSTEEEKA